MSNQQTTALSVDVQQVAAAIGVGELFKDVNFNGLASAIDKIADNNTNMSKEERAAACVVVDEWNGSIIKRLHERKQQMDSFLSFFELVEGSHWMQDSYVDKLETTGYDIAERTGTMTEYNAYIDAREALHQHRQNRPQEPIFDMGTTTQARLDSEAAYKLATTQYKIDESKLSRAVRNTELTWKNLVKQKDEIKTVLRKARSFTRNLNKFTNDCQEKAQLAKLNINVVSKEVRDSLRELLDFAITI